MTDELFRVVEEARIPDDDIEVLYAIYFADPTTARPAPGPESRTNDIDATPSDAACRDVQRLLYERQRILAALSDIKGEVERLWAEIERHANALSAANERLTKERDGLLNLRCPRCGEWVRDNPALSTPTEETT